VSDKDNSQVDPKAISGEDISQQISDSLEKPEVELKPPTTLAIRNLRCPACDAKFEQNCHGLMEEIACPECGVKAPYVYSYLNFYKEYIEIFIDPIHPLPMVPGYSTSGRVMSIPDDLLYVDFGMTYNRPPEVFFVFTDIQGEKAARQLILKDQVLLPISIAENNFILYARSLSKATKAEPSPVTWVAIGDTGDWERPLWLNYMQNAAELVRNGEEVAAIVLMMIALDFFYDHVLERIGITYDVIRKKGRRPGMNEKRAKLKYLSEILGDWPSRFAEELSLLTDYRNQIVHGQIKQTTVKSYNSRRAFQIVLRAILFLIEMLHRPRPDEPAK